MPKKQRLKLTYFNRLELCKTRKDLVAWLNNNDLSSFPLLKVKEDFPALALKKDDVVSLEKIVPQLEQSTLLVLDYRKTKLRGHINAACRRRISDGIWYAHD
jgi:hypothetical protein